MTTTYTVRLRDRGQLTLPQAVRRGLSVDDGDMLNLVQIGDFVWLSPRQALIPKLSTEFASIMESEGVSLAELLQGLADERAASRRAPHGGDA
jgi:bifunctional DNA-binding transcriptional regulator/antitoxin component of YhaV-PrlF toxin-antitoxin module